MSYLKRLYQFHVTLYFKTGMLNSQRYPPNLYLTKNTEDISSILEIIKSNILTIFILWSHFHNKATIENNQFLERKLRYHIHLCSDNGFNGIFVNWICQLVNLKLYFFWQQKWDACQKSDLFVQFNWFFYFKIESVPTWWSIDNLPNKNSEQRCVMKRWTGSLSSPDKDNR